MSETWTGPTTNKQTRCTTPCRSPVFSSCTLYYTGPSLHALALTHRSHISTGEARESRSSAKTKLERTVRPLGKRAAGGFSGDSPSHASQSLSFLAACRHFGGALGSERHLAQREDLRLPCGQRELPGQLPSLQSYLLRPCSHTWLPLHPSRSAPPSTC